MCLNCVTRRVDWKFLAKDGALRASHLEGGNRLAGIHRHACDQAATQHEFLRGNFTPVQAKSEYQITQIEDRLARRQRAVISAQTTLFQAQTRLSDKSVLIVT